MSEERFNQEIYKQQLMSLIRVPSISQDALANPKGEARGNLGEVLVQMASITEGCGFKPQILETDGFPVLVAHLDIDDSKPRLLVYNHMDVQPAKEPEWKMKPFEPEIKGDRIYGRGATDDKGPALTIVHAINFLRSNNLPMPNITLVYETEEEIGSPNFGNFVKKSLEERIIDEPDSILVSDTTFEGDFPAITYKLRGVLKLFASLKTGERDAHSGLAGGVAINPLEVLTRAISSCKDENGRIKIKGWYDGIEELSQQEIDSTAIVARHFDIQKYKRDMGLVEMATNDSLDILNRLWHQPTLELHGYTGQSEPTETVKTAIAKGAMAKLTGRLVPGQNPDNLIKLFEDHLRMTHPEIRVTGGGLPACLTNVDDKFIRKAAEACEYGFEIKPLFVGGGGSIGAVAEFQRIMPKVPVVLIAQSLLADGYHAPNESFSLIQAEKGFKTMVKYISDVADYR